MRIAYIVSSLANSGPIIVVNDLVHEFVLHGHSCDVFYFDDKVQLDFPCYVQKINFTDHIDWKKYDIVHSHGFRPDLFVFIRKPINRIKTKFISSIHGYLFAEQYSIWGTIRTFLSGGLVLLAIMRHERLVVLSKGGVRFYKRFVKFSKIKYAYNTTRIIDLEGEISTNDKNKILEFKENSILIGCNCGMSFRKGIDMLLKALVTLPDFKLVLVGNGPDKARFEQLSKQLGIEDRVCFMGYRPQAYRFLKYYDIYAMPSRSEGFPLALLEAAACGKYVITSDLPIFLETFSESEIVTFKMEDINDLRRALLSYTEQAVEAFQDNIKKRFVEDYNPERFYDRYFKIYKELMR